MKTNYQLPTAELWELLGKGAHKAWPDAIKYHGGTKYGYYLDDHGDRALITVEHALAIVRDHIEGRLVECIECIVKDEDKTQYVLSMLPGGAETTVSLTDAVRYALGKEKE